MYKIATWNVNSLRVRLEHLSKWIERENPDVIALQETKCPDAVFPEEAIRALGYHAIYSGQATFNGVAILSKEKSDGMVTDIPAFADPERRILCATINDIRIINLYVPNGSAIDSEKYHYKLKWLNHVTDFIQEQLTQFEKVLVLGDFNIAPTDADVYDPVAWQGQVLVSDRERKAFEKIMALGLTDSIRLFHPETLYSWWDYRNGAFWKNQGLRIDHILISKALQEKAISCDVNHSPRKWARPSDHAPVMITFGEA